jgi:hypothetical protein
MKVDVEFSTQMGFRTPTVSSAAAEGIEDTKLYKGCPHTIATAEVYDTLGQTGSTYFLA